MKPVRLLLNAQKIEQELLQYFRNHFDKILAEYNLTGFSEELELDEKNNLIVKITGMADISTKGIRYQPEFETNFKVNFDFNDFSEVLNQASDCVQKERIKGQTSNLLFEDCRNDPSFDWVIKENEKIDTADSRKALASFLGLNKLVSSFLFLILNMSMTE